MKRFSVLYIRQQQHYQIYCSTLPEAQSALHQISGKPNVTPIGIYDAKTELFFWESRGQAAYNQANIEEQGKLGNQIIEIAQALRYRDVEWQRAGAQSRLSFFA